MEHEQIEFGNYSASRLQLRELAENIKSGDIDFCSDMLQMFENQKLERLRENDKASRETLIRQIEQEQKTQHKDD